MRYDNQTQHVVLDGVLCQKGKEALLGWLVASERGWGGWGFWMGRQGCANAGFLIGGLCGSNAGECPCVWRHAVESIMSEKEDGTNVLKH